MAAPCEEKQKKDYSSTAPMSEYRTVQVWRRADQTENKTCKCQHPPNTSLPRPCRCIDWQKLELFCWGTNVWIWSIRKEERRKVHHQISTQQIKVSVFVIVFFVRFQKLTVFSLYLVSSEFVQFHNVLEDQDQVIFGVQFKEEWIVREYLIFISQVNGFSPQDSCSVWQQGPDQGWRRCFYLKHLQIFHFYTLQIIFTVSMLSR